MTEILEARKTPAAVGQQPRPAVVTVGRFQPPTRGHYAVIDAMRQFIREHQSMNLHHVPVLVIVDGKKTSQDKGRNPLSVEDRIRFIRASGRAHGVKLLTADSAFAAFEEIRRNGFEPTVIAAGSDRGRGYIEMLNRYFRAEDGSRLPHYLVPDLDRDMDSDHDDGPEAFDEIIRAINEDDDVPISQISASLARYAAGKGQEKAFAYIAGLEDAPELAQALAAKIRTVEGT